MDRVAVLENIKFPYTAKRAVPQIRSTLIEFVINYVAFFLLRKNEGIRLRAEAEKHSMFITTLQLVALENANCLF